VEDARGPKCARPSPGEGFIAHRMRISGELQLMLVTEELTLESIASVQPVPRLFSNPSLVETRRCLRRQVRKEAAQS